MPLAKARGSKVLSMPNTTSATGADLLRMSLLSISPASPPLTTCSLTPASFSNLANKGLGKSNELCAITRSGVLAQAAPGNKPAAAQATPKDTTETKNRRCMQTAFLSINKPIGEPERKAHCAHSGKGTFASRSLRWHNPDQVRGVFLSLVAQRNPAPPVKAHIVGSSANNSSPCHMDPKRHHAQSPKNSVMRCNSSSSADANAWP